MNARFGFFLPCTGVMAYGVNRLSSWETHLSSAEALCVQNEDEPSGLFEEQMFSLMDSNEAVLLSLSAPPLS